MGKKKVVEAVVATAATLLANSNLRKTILGEYSDGTPRSLSDCLEGEIISPKDREKILRTGEKKKCKSKNKNGKSNKDKKKKKKMGKIKL